MHQHHLQSMEPAASELRELAGSLGAPIWPSVPMTLPGVLWPDPDDRAGFRRIVEDCSPSLVFFEYTTAAGVADLDLDLAEFSPSDPVFVSCGIVHDGLWLHLTYVSVALETELQLLEHRQQVDQVDRERRVEQLAREVFDDPAFHDHGGAGRDERTRAVVREAFPDLDDHMVWRVARRGQQLDWTEAKPDREAALAVEAHRRYADGETKVDIATSMGITTNVLSRIMQQNPPTAPSE
jgi:hypothetical protein